MRTGFRSRPRRPWPNRPNIPFNLAGTGSSCPEMPLARPGRPATSASRPHRCLARVSRRLTPEKRPTIQRGHIRWQRQASANKNRQRHHRRRRSAFYSRHLGCTSDCTRTTNVRHAHPRADLPDLVLSVPGGWPRAAASRDADRPTNAPSTGGWNRFRSKSPTLTLKNRRPVAQLSATCPGPFRNNLVDRRGRQADHRRDPAGTRKELFEARQIPRPRLSGLLTSR